MQKQLAALDVEFELIEAVDGASLGEDELKLYSKNAAIKSCGRELSRGEIGCALSHAKIWKRIQQEQIEAVLVLEDDVKISRSLLEILENKVKFPQNYEFINFYTDAPQIPFSPFVYDIYRFSRHKGYANRTCCYLITQKGASKLLNKVYPIRWAADGITGRTYLTDLVSYGIYPQVAVLGDFESSICQNGSLPPSNTLTKMYASLKKTSKIVLSAFNCY